MCLSLLPLFILIGQPLAHLPTCLFLPPLFILIGHQFAQGAQEGGVPGTVSAGVGAGICIDPVRLHQPPNTVSVASPRTKLDPGRVH